MTKGRKYKFIRTIILIVYLSYSGINGIVFAQDTIPVKVHDVYTTDTIPEMVRDVFAPDSIKEKVFDYAIDSTIIFYGDSLANTPVYNAPRKTKVVIKKDSTAFKPKPNVAWKVSLFFPGFGQIYNRQYWKLPIVYGGLMGLTYAITWNNKTYQDYKTAYFDIIYDSKNDPNSMNPEGWSQSWQDFVRPSELHNKNSHDKLKRGKDYFRRYRDLSIILCVAVYGIFIADSYVDAQMFDFDVSPDLSFRATPEFWPETIHGSRSFGFNICMTF